MTRAEVISLFPNGVPLGVGIGDPRHQIAASYPEEEENIGRAVPKRVNEFRMGRAAARSAMTDIGITASAIPSRSDRTPDWPDGLVGSISHCEDMCIATVSKSLRSIGVDVEQSTDLPAEIWDEILLPEEQRVLASLPRSGEFAKLVFSAKEAAYKAQYPLSHTLFGFHDLGLEWAPDGTFTATFLCGAGPFASGDSLAGRFMMTDQHIVTAVAVA